MIGVGLEELGVEEFVAEKFFDGELFLDTKKKSYEDMGFKRFGMLAAIPELLKVNVDEGHTQVEFLYYVFSGWN